MKTSLRSARKYLLIFLLAGFSGTALPDQLTLTVNADHFANAGTAPITIVTGE